MREPGDLVADEWNQFARGRRQADVQPARPPEIRRPRQHRHGEQSAVVDHLDAAVDAIEEERIDGARIATGEGGLSFEVGQRARPRGVGDELDRGEAFGGAVVEVAAPVRLGRAQRAVPSRVSQEKERRAIVGVDEMGAIRADAHRAVPLKSVARKHRPELYTPATL